MSTGLHKDLANAEIHTVVAWIYADASARVSATGFVASDLYKLAYQTSTSTLWVLTGHSPISWLELASGTSQLLNRVEVGCVKSTPGTLSKGQVVYVANWDTVNDRAECELARANSPTTLPAVGIVDVPATDSVEGTLMIVGVMHDIDTSGLTELAPMYVSHLVAGEITTTPPPGPFVVQAIGQVLKTDATEGHLGVNILSYRAIEYATTPEVVGTGSAGTSNVASASDHSHALPAISHGDLQNVGTLSHDEIDNMHAALFPITGPGLISGGLLTLTSGVGFSIAVGTGVSPATDQLELVEWGALTGSCLYAGMNFIGIDEGGAISVSQQHPGPDTDVIGVGSIYTDNTNSTVIGFSPMTHPVDKFHGRVHNFVRQGLGALVVDGLEVSEQSSPNELKLSIAAGEYYAELNVISVDAATTLVKVYNSSSGWQIDSSGANTVNVTQWNNVSAAPGSALITMTAGYWKKDLVLTLSNGTIYYVYGQDEYATEDEANDAALPSVGVEIVAGGACFLTVIVSQKDDTSIGSRLRDVRPLLSRLFGHGAGSAGVVVDHGALTGLTDDDHVAYYNAARLTSWLAARDTDDLGEGSSNLYHTEARVTANTNVAANTSHRGSSANPHSVTKAQVGLTNVTDDAQLKRAAADFASFTAKASPVGADALLIEDSADSNNKKRLLISNLPAGVDSTAIHKATNAEISALALKSIPAAADVLLIEDSAASFSKKRTPISSLQSVFGQDYQTAVSLSESSTTSTAWQTKLTLTTPALTGTYRVSFSCRVWQANISDAVQVLLYNATDGTDLLGLFEFEPKDVKNRISVSAFAEVVFTGAFKAFQVEYRQQRGNTAYIDQARVEIWRVS